MTQASKSERRLEVGGTLFTVTLNFTNFILQNFGSVFSCTLCKERWDNPCLFLLNPNIIEFYIIVYQEVKKIEVYLLLTPLAYENLPLVSVNTAIELTVQFAVVFKENEV